MPVPFPLSKTSAVGNPSSRQIKWFGVWRHNAKRSSRKEEQSLWFRRSPPTDNLAVRYWLPRRLRWLVSTGVVASAREKLGEGGRPREGGREGGRLLERFKK